MDDEEEDMSRPISQLWGTSFREVKYEERAAQIAAGQALAAVTAAVSSPRSHNNNSIDALPCSFHRQPRVPFHGNAGLRSHFPAQFEPMEDRGERQVEDEEEEEEEEEQRQQQQQQQGRGEENDRMAAERPEEQAGLSVEAQIGRKLREIGDKFHQDHVELFLRHQRQNLPIWMRLTNALFGFFFPERGSVPAPERGAEMRGAAGLRPRFPNGKQNKNKNKKRHRT
ncbi:uncharacterized protein LOC115401847 [Salarias fasciatus]|uniref:uncharacterized protein LOC115401847 n=1 Tax=Salarias fasciatus TaxID=181472 RepID=UPI001176F273|nr:uncharacterized protein LOC115401847 [Salarias fasciatus]XP_029966062.1 uncharacterized protein LOC115401847 [Salarias fasciatus]